MSASTDTPRKWRLRRYTTGGLLGLSVIVVLGVVVVLLTRPTTADAFRWFSGLGFPDVKGQKFVRIATGQWSQSGDEPPANHYTDGFLLSQSSNTFVVLTKDLFIRSFTNTPPDTAAHKSVGYKPLDLATESEAYLAQLRHPPTNLWRRFGEPVPERAEAFVMAWACNRNGQSKAAQEIFQQASLMCEVVPYETNWLGSARERVDHFLHRPPKKLPIIQQMERDLGHAMMWRTIVSFGDPTVSRKELLHRLQNIVSNYPDSEHVQRARNTAEVLQRMIKEDETHASLGLAAVSAMSTNRQIAEWIFRLRDQNGQQWSQPGWCDIFMDYLGTTNTPAHELVRMGYAAVPQLISVIDDQTLTRSVGYHRNFYFSHTVLTVGDCAVTILQRITGKSFYAPKTTSSYSSNDGGASVTRKAAEKWWADFQTKGERQSLIDAVASGDDDAPAQAELLKERFPSDAFAAITRGAHASKSEWTRTRFVELAAKLNDQGVTNFLDAEMRDGPGLRTRVVAAQASRKRGERSSIAAMIREWERWNDFSEEPNDGGEELIAFLAGTDSPEAIATLGRDLPRRKVDTRLQVVESLGGHNSWVFNEENEKLSAATLTAIEAELVKALDDLEQRMGMSGTWNDKAFTDPRVCDFAGHFLAKRWPERYVFDLSASLEIRERQRIECQKVWQRAHGAERPAPAGSN